jgi:DNA modification methylase
LVFSKKLDKIDMRIYNEDNIKTLKNLEPNSVDSVITDPPYGLSFMNKKWDYQVPSIDFWKEVYRVLKPGGHILSFGGTRTYHRMVVNIEDAGFEIRDQIMWIYGSGFPKSLNIGKKSNEYEGWGTALKPANEPIVLARKPLSEKSVAQNVMKWRTGGLNIDGCRVGDETIREHTSGKNALMSGLRGGDDSFSGYFSEAHQGRFPANVILECICDEVIKGENGKFRMGSKINGDVINPISYKIGAFVENYDYNDKGDIHTNTDCPCYMLNKQSGYLKSGEVKPHHKKNKTTYKFYTTNSYSKIENKDTTLKGYGDGGGASRFFYVAKVSKRERNFGLDDITNNHPTVKPITLLTYLCRLITPEKGIILDPFMGSGSTGVAALLEGFDFIGMELEKDYYDIAEQRIKNYELYKKIIK